MASSSLKIFLCGDVMTGRGIDQILPYPSDPEIHEGVVSNALGYVALSEREHGPIQRPVPFEYIWGDALEALEREAPDVRIINLETSVTTSDDWLPKGINYRMHPENVPCLTAAGVQCCVLSNNHVLDWGHEGLFETLRVLRAARLPTPGAGCDLTDARAPAVIDVPGAGRVVVLALGTESSGIPGDWGAGPARCGVNLLRRLSDRAVAAIADQVDAFKQPGDVIVASIHWGGNWGYAIPESHQHFARRLIDEAEIDVVHGHSSHHPQGIEIYRGHPILYGSGDFINDYEGIGGHRHFRGELSLMYFLEVDPSGGRLLALRMHPMRIRRFRLERTSRDDARWLCDMLARESRPFGVQVTLDRVGEQAPGWVLAAA